ncbi:MAG: carbamoyltransferase N-terminal domain-containing protein, partial [Tumebacillaceae bacterium]
MSYVLGVSVSHDASACLMRDGEILFAIQEERVSRIKHDGNRYLSQTRAIDYCLQAAGITIDDVELIVINGQQLTHGYAGLSVPWPDADFQLFDPFSEKCLYISHHLAHAFSAFGPSPYEAAAVMVVDGMGSNTPLGKDLVLTGPEMRRYLTAPHAEPHKSESESYYLFENGTYRLLDRVHSGSFNVRAGSQAVGEAYAAISQYIFGDWRESSKVMALASLGDASRYPWKIIEITPEGPKLNRNWQLQFQHPNRWPDNQTEYRDLAARIQQDLEEYLVWRAEKLAGQTGQPNLCLAGGVILNVPGNQKIIESGAFANVYIQPAAHDAGISLGCAFYGHYHLKGELTGTHVRNDFHGRAYDEAEILAV